MGRLVERFGQKSPGQLIQSRDWNRMVADIEASDETTNNRIDELSKTVDGLVNTINSEVDGLKARMQRLGKVIDEIQSASDALRQRVENVFKDNYRVSLETTKVDYALGEMARVTARLTDLEGKPVDLSKEAARPWIDFVTSWGRLKPLAGFESLGSVGDRTLSVKVDQTGAAVVLLRSEHTEDFTDEVEQQMEASLQTRLQSSGKSIAETVLTAKTPREAKDTGIFQRMSAEYDRQDVFSVRSYVDTYFQKSALTSPAKFKALPGHRDFQATWRDYRSTVLAFAKRDSNPRTPDPGLGVSSIQVTFRDWIGPWITLSYFEEKEQPLRDIHDRLAAKVTRDLRGSIDLIKQEVNNIVKDRGIIGAHRDYMLIHEAMDKLKVPDSAKVAFDVPTLTKSVKQGVSLQRSLLAAQAASGASEDEDTAFDVITDATTRADTRTDSIKSEIDAIRGKVDKANENFSAIQGQVSTLNSSVGTLQQLNSRVRTVETKVDKFNEINVNELKAGLTNANAVKNAVDVLLRRGQP